MQNKIDQLRQRKMSCVISGALVVLFFALVADAGIESRWAAIFSGLTPFLLALIVWVAWITHLAWLLSKRPPIFPSSISLVATVITGVLAFYGAIKLGSHLSESVRARELQPAIAAGLREDCLQLLLNWPVKRARINNTDPEFAQLPASIKMLEPAYLDNDNIDNPDLPPNVGICKNGFGGFAMGFRVFRSDEDATKFKNKTVGGCQRIGPGVYCWWHPT